MNRKFKSFLESIKTDNNKTVIESIHQGFTACFEAYYTFDEFFASTDIYKQIKRKCGDSFESVMGDKRIKKMRSKLNHMWSGDAIEVKPLMKEYVKAIGKVFSESSGSQHEFEEDDGEDIDYKPEKTKQTGNKLDRFMSREFGILGKGVLGAARLAGKGIKKL